MTAERFTQSENEGNGSIKVQPTASADSLEAKVNTESTPSETARQRHIQNNPNNENPKNMTEESAANKIGITVDALKQIAELRPLQEDDGSIKYNYADVYAYAARQRQPSTEQPPADQLAGADTQPAVLTPQEAPIYYSFEETL